MLHLSVFLLTHVKNCHSCHKYNPHIFLSLTIMTVMLATSAVGDRYANIEESTCSYDDTD